VIEVRPVTREDASAWLAMRCALWPDSSHDHADEVDRFFAGAVHEPLAVLIALDGSGAAVGFAELSIRNIVDGCSTDRVGYLEGWYVAPQVRRQGVGRALVEAAEAWARTLGCTEFGSDTEIDNAVSAAAHHALGFTETDRIRTFRKAI
jgi:aminoglycoside 6'-N-acetyltransferase I